MAGSNPKLVSILLYIKDTKSIAGLGKLALFGDLSEKRITRATRQALRAQYGFGRITVSCDAQLHGGEWWGRSVINGSPLKYHISR